MDRRNLALSRRSRLRPGVKVPVELRRQLDAIGTCQRKVRYKTAIDADLDLARLWAHHRWNMVKYECQWCYQWHLTHGKWRDLK